MEKRVDESWKEQVEKEKEKFRQDRPAADSVPPSEASPAGGRRSRSGQPPAASEFSMFLSTLSMQALMSLGEIPHPVTQTAQADLEQARYLIDVIGMLKEKTQGNLSPEEAALIEDVLYELRMKYVAKTEGTTTP